MAKKVVEYEELDELVKIAEELAEKYPDKVAGVDVAKIAAVKIIGKERAKTKNQMWDVKSITPPVSLFCSKEYIVSVFAEDWDSLGKNHRAALVFDIMLSLEGDGKIKPFDTKDHSVILKTLGVDYMSNPNLPDIMDGRVNWDDGSL